MACRDPGQSPERALHGALLSPEFKPFQRDAWQSRKWREEREAEAATKATEAAAKARWRAEFPLAAAAEAAEIAARVQAYRDREAAQREAQAAQWVQGEPARRAQAALVAAINRPGHDVWG